MGYSLENGLEWLFEGNDLLICYTESQNGGEYKEPLCFDFTGTDYVAIITQPEILIPLLLFGVMIYATLKFWVDYRSVANAESTGGGK